MKQLFALLTFALIMSLSVGVKAASEKAPTHQCELVKQDVSGCITGTLACLDLRLSMDFGPKDATPYLVVKAPYTGVNIAKEIAHPPTSES